MPAPRKSDAQRLARRVRKGKHADLRDERSALLPYLAELHNPSTDILSPGPDSPFSIATYNVHKWGGRAGGRTYAPDRAEAVLRELDADVLALQEVLRPFEGNDPLVRIAEHLGYTMAFVCTRLHRRGELGNAVLARWPIAAAFAIDLSFGKLEQRSALAVQFRGSDLSLTVAATHLALVDRTRERQVKSLLSHPQIANGPVVLLGDMNAWRRSAADKRLDNEFLSRHHNDRWPASYPSIRPIMSLDRAYARGAVLKDLRTHTSATARKGSDHLPVLADVHLKI
ncbi:MAG: endonuclease/exonuclease/phosphatase family protein [Rubricoccaceae bacterium]|nr:endonuclease/exonuclease/phosphatase family protein [Rubricoccaceae bacterium]